jgi:hypothetical protein
VCVVWFTCQAVNERNSVFQCDTEPKDENMQQVCSKHATQKETSTKQLKPWKTPKPSTARILLQILKPKPKTLKTLNLQLLNPKTLTL